MPRASQWFVVIGVYKGCLWHGVANLLFVLRCLRDARVNSFAQSLVFSGILISNKKCPLALAIKIHFS